jgi:hypothetical protein
MTFLSRITSSGKSVEPRKKFKRGDKVRVTRAIRSYAEGWNNSWVRSMDQAVGKIGTVISDFGNTGVSLDIPGATSQLSYPASVLQLTESKPQPAVVNTPKFFIGQRVNVDYHPDWNGPAIIYGIYNPDSICVIPESGMYKNRQGVFSPKNLSPILTAPETVPAPKPLFSKSTALTTARRIAIELATKNGKVTADDVQFELRLLGVEQLGNQAGSIFSGFVNSGTTVKSKREGNRGRRIIVWNLPDKIPQSTSTSKFIVEVKQKNSPDWQRSWNKTQNGMYLKDFTFGTLKEAATEAERQEQRMRAKYPSFGHRYRAVEVK